MIAFKKNYFFIIEDIKYINLKKIKRNKKYILIYRNKENIDDLDALKRFRKNCKLKFIKFYVANDIKLAIALNADGIYISASNKSFKSLILRKKNFNIIGSAHNFKEIDHKLRQGCRSILVSKLFTVDYAKRSVFLGIIKFNNLFNYCKFIVPLGGIKLSNLNYLKNVRSNSFAILTELKKKPANIVNRLF